MAEALTFEISPAGTLVTFGLLDRSIATLRRMIEEVDYAATRQATRLWVVQDIHTTNPTMTVRPMLDTEGVVDIVAEGLHVVTSGEGYEPPPFFPLDTLQRLRRMRSLFTDRRESLSRIQCRADNVAVANIDQSIGPKVDRILSRGYVLLGSLEGQLDAISLHGAAMFTIWDRVTGQPVRCYFNREQKEQIKPLLEKRVLVAGEVRYFVNGLPSLIKNIREIRVIESDDTRPEVRFGGVPDGYITNGRDSVEHVKALREE